jgi:hypothetical protein
MSVPGATLARAALAPAILSTLLLAGCGGGERELRSRVTVKLPSVDAVTPADNAQTGKVTAKQAALGTSNERATSEQTNLASSSRYSSLEQASCELVQGTGQEGKSARRRCAGSAGYALETSENDPLYNLAIVSPRGARSQLDLSDVVPDGDLGTTAEWRGQGKGQPRALIMRVTDTNNTSDLVVVKLGETPCIVGVVPRGPGQNAKARAVADGKLLNCAKG